MKKKKIYIYTKKLKILFSLFIVFTFSLRIKKTIEDDANVRDVNIIEKIYLFTTGNRYLEIWNYIIEFWILNKVRVMFQLAFYGVSFLPTFFLIWRYPHRFYFLFNRKESFWSLKQIYKNKEIWIRKLENKNARYLHTTTLNIESANMVHIKITNRENERYIESDGEEYSK